MALQLIHSARKAEDSESLNEEPPLTVISGGRDPLAEARAQEEAKERQHRDWLAKMQAEEIERQRQFDERMRQYERYYAIKKWWLGGWAGFLFASFALYFVLVRCHVPQGITLPFLLVAGFVSGQMLRRAI